MGGNIKVMIVDDSKTMLATITAHLKNSRFEIVATASNGAEAFEKYLELKPHLMLLDMVMPGLSGVETLERVLQSDARANIIMVSTLGMETAAAQCVRKGAKGILQKPLKKEDMLALLTTICGTMD